jgi:hypothetical protein
MFTETVSVDTCDEFTFRTRKKILGERFGRLVPFNRYLAPHIRMDYFYWHCQCDCGRMPLVAQEGLLRGDTTSCGCYQREVAKKANTTHGRAGCVDGKCVDRTYRVWVGMLGRCYTPSNNRYKWYGAKGVTVCDRWRYSFENFLADMGERPPGLTLDRWPDKSGPYSPGNCRWATRKQQNSNKDNNLMVEYEGEVMTLTEAAGRCGIVYGTLNGRYHRGLRGDALFSRVGLYRPLQPNPQTVEGL